MKNVILTRQKSVLRLVIIWSISSALLVTLVMVQSILGKYGNDSKDVWGWLTSNILAALSLLFTASLMDSHKIWGQKPGSRLRLSIATSLSVIQLASMAITLLAEPLTHQNWHELIDVTELPLAIWQSASIAAVSSVIFEGR